MKIQLTENAAKQIRKQLAQRGKGIGLRVGVKDAGCSGFAYIYDYADEVRADDQLIEAHDVKVVVDAKSLETLDGSTLDFVVAFIPREDILQSESSRSRGIA